VEPIFSRYVAAHDLSDRLRFIPGDFFADDLPQADVLVMGLILHDWDLPTKRMLIGKAHSALEKGGTLIVYEFLIDDARRTHLPGLLMSLNMLIETRGGFDFTGADCMGWMRDAGFSDYLGRARPRLPAKAGLPARHRRECRDPDGQPDGGFHVVTRLPHHWPQYLRRGRHYA
jgi:hypothetical protein